MGGLFSPDFVEEPWSLAKIWDLTKHRWNDADWLARPDAVPVSLTLPLRPEPYDSRSLHPFFENLLPEGWLIMDMPGLRELQLWAGAEGIDRTFEEIGELGLEPPIVGGSEAPGCADANEGGGGGDEREHWEI